MLASIKKEMLFLAHDLIGSNLRKIYEEYMQIEKWKRSDLNLYVEKKLSNLLRYASKNIPYYRDRVNTENPEISDFPIITKKELREHYVEFMSLEIKRDYFSGKKINKIYSWKEVTTGGSTGEPTRVIHDRIFRDYGRAGRLYSNYLCGFPIGVSYFYLWGSMEDINNMRKNIPSILFGWILGVYPMNAFRMTEDDMKRYVQIINSAKHINHMMAYTDAVYFLARFIKENNFYIRKLNSVMACAGTVTPEIRELIEDVFKCKVHNKYGSRDCGDIACECSEGNMHIYSNHVYLEIVDWEGKPVKEGEEGRILVTLLNNYGFPLIRYEIGDVGVINSEEICNCGRPHPILKSVSGRIYEYITDTKGNYITPVYIRHLIGVVHYQKAIKRFQLNQLSQKSYELLLEIPEQEKSQIGDNVISNIRRDLLAVLGYEADIQVKIVNFIPESKSGKFLYVRNLYLNDHDKRKTS